jgi:transcriptional regulator with XRE-family HTH domain
VRNQPTITTIAKLARALGVTASELVAEAERASLIARAKVKK